MKLSIFTTHGSVPYDPFDDCMLDEAMACYTKLADEVILVNGCSNHPKKAMWPPHIIGYEWPEEFSWEFIGEQFQRGYEATTGDWAIHADLDFIFHERDYGRLRQALKDYPSSPAVSFYKWQFNRPDRYNLKSRLVLAVNKAAFGDRIKFNGGGDLCQPTLDGNDLDLNEVPQAGIPFFNYEKPFKTKEQIMEDVSRMDRAYQRRFGKWLYSSDGTPESAFEGWMRMAVGRGNKPSKVIPLHDHPKVMQKALANLKPDQFGYDGFGNWEVCSYVEST